MFEGLQGIKFAIDEFKTRTGAEPDEMMVIIGKQMADFFKIPVMKGVKPKVYGVELYVDERIPDEIFGVCYKSCKNHIEEHIDELINGPEDRPEWIQCDLCQHPISLEMADGCDLTCPWCGDVNDLDDILGDDEE